MKPAPFTYHRPRELTAALGLLAELRDDAKVLAGGQSLVPLLALRLAAPPHLVDIGGLAELGTVTVRDGAAGPEVVSIGANVTHRTIEQHPDLARLVPLLAEAVRFIAHPQVRNRGTICGSLAHADPSAELPAVALALDAVLVVASARGTRRVDAADFFVSYLDTALAADEILVAVELPVAAAGHGAAFCEVSRRNGDFAMAGVAAAVDRSPDGTIRRARLALAGVASTPVRATAAEVRLAGATPDDATILAAVDAAVASLEPPDDVHATAAYRVHVTRALVGRALRSACTRAGAVTR